MEKWRIRERRRYGAERSKIREKGAEGGGVGGRIKGERKREIERGKGVFLPGQGQIYHGRLSEGQAGPEDFCPEAISPPPSQVLSGLQSELKCC